MSKSPNASYERFRRKNSLNSYDMNRSSSSSEISTLKLKHNENYSEIQNLAAQLQNFSKRSLSSRSFCEETPKHSYSSTNLNQTIERVAQDRFFKPSIKEELFTPTKKDIAHPKQDKSLTKQVREKISSSAIFNKFDIIQEDHYLNESQEMAEEIQPVTFKQNPTAKVPEKKTITKVVQLKPSLVPKKTVSAKMENNGAKKQKIKIELGQLQKMQKQLDSKRTAREHNSSRTQGANILRRGKEATELNHKESTKMTKSAIPHFDNKMQKMAKPAKIITNFLLTAKMSESKHEIQTFEEEKMKSEEIPTRMISQKQKLGLIERVQTLRQIIQKNDICSESMDHILTYFVKIEKLLTK